MSRVLESLPLDRIRIDGGTQPRAALDPATIQNYAEAMSRGEMFPPLIVFHDGETYWLADGFHRLQAAKDSTTHPEPEIDCEIKQGTQRDAVLFSAGANATHGLPRSNEDKRRAVMRLLSDDEWSEWSDRRIADVCHVDHKTVGKYRAELGKFPSKRKYIKDGTESTMDTSRIAESNVERAAEDADIVTRSNDLTVRIPDLLAGGGLRYPDLRDQLGIDETDMPAISALRRALDTLLGSQRIVKDRGMYKVASPEPDVDEADQAAVQIAYKLPVRQRELLGAVASGEPVVKNAATRTALINRGLLKSHDGEGDWWSKIEMTPKGEQVAEVILSAESGIPPTDDTGQLPDLEPLILAELEDGPKRLTQLLVRVRQKAAGPGKFIGSELSDTLDRMVEDGTITRKYGQGTGKAVEYETNVVKTSNGGEKAPSLDDLRDQIVGWLNTQVTSQRPFWKNEIRKKAGIKAEHDALFDQALAQLVDRGVMKQFANGQYHFTEFDVTLPDRLAHLPERVRAVTTPGQAFTITDLNNYDDGVLQVPSGDLKPVLDYMVEQGELTCSGAPKYVYTRPVAITQSEPEREPDPDRPVDPVHTRNPLVDSDEWGYLDQRPIRVVLNAIASLEALEGALTAIDGTEFTLALAHNPQYPTARKVKQADETALRVCAQIVRLDVLCAQFAKQQAAQKAESEQPAEPVSDTTADPETGQQPEAVT